MKRLRTLLEEVASRLDIKIEDYEFLPNTAKNKFSIFADIKQSKDGTIEKITKVVVKYPRWVNELNDDALKGAYAHELGHLKRFEAMGKKGKIGRLLINLHSFAQKYKSCFLGRILLISFEKDVNEYITKKGFEKELDALRKFYRDRGFKIY
jgi:hypothetical protein